MPEKNLVQAFQASQVEISGFNPEKGTTAYFSRSVKLRSSFAQSQANLPPAKGEPEFLSREISRHIMFKELQYQFLPIR